MAKNSNQTVKYFVRKNHFYYAENFYFLGNATQLIGPYIDFQTVKKSWLKELQLVLLDMIGNCFEMYKPKNRYGLIEFMRFGKNSQKNNFGYEYLGEKYYNRLENLEDVEIFNHKYPTGAVDIVFTPFNYLLAPKFNKEYFELLNREMPKSQFVDEYGESHNFLDKGLFIDELDYFNNIMKGKNKLKLVSIYNNLPLTEDIFKSKEEMIVFANSFKNSIEIDSQNRLNLVKNSDKFNEIITPEYYVIKAINEFLKIKPIEFQKIPIDKIEDFQLESYKEIISDCLTWVYGLPPSPIGINDFGFESVLSLKKSFVEKIIKSYNLANKRN